MTRGNSSSDRCGRCSFINPSSGSDGSERSEVEPEPAPRTDISPSVRPRTLFGIWRHSQLLWKWHRRFRLQGRKPRPGAGMRRRAEQQGPRTHPPDGSRTRSSPPSLLSGWNRWHVASIYGNSRWRGDSENCSAWRVQVLQSGNAFCGAAPTLYQAPIPGR